RSRRRRAVWRRRRRRRSARRSLLHDRQTHDAYLRPNCRTDRTAELRGPPTESRPTPTANAATAIPTKACRAAAAPPRRVPTTPVCLDTRLYEPVRGSAGRQVRARGYRRVRARLPRATDLSVAGI